MTEVVHGLAHAAEADHGPAFAVAQQALYAYALPRLIGLQGRAAAAPPPPPQMYPPAPPRAPPGFGGRGYGRGRW